MKRDVVAENNELREKYNELMAEYERLKDDNQYSATKAKELIIQLDTIKDGWERMLSELAKEYKECVELKRSLKTMITSVQRQMFKSMRKD